MKTVISLDERIDRQVGRRRAVDGTLLARPAQVGEAMAARAAFGGVRIPRGVHRFRTHAEADAWLWRMIARPTAT